MLTRIEVLLEKAHTPGFCFDRNRYFIDALAKYSDAQFCLRPFSAELFAALRSRNVRGMYNLWGRWASLFKNRNLPLTTDHIGQYLFMYDNLSVKVAIDTSDGRHLHDQDILRWSDVYFKCNFWPMVNYPDKVVPLLNGNGTLSPAKIRKLKRLRNHKKKYDLVYWSRIWATPESGSQNNGVEHNVRLFEALAKVEGKINLLAVFPEEMNNSSLQEYRNRLDAAGVKWQNGWGNINSNMLWDSLASAHINFLRPGNHLCVSWRMMDLLCLGSCIMVDGNPYAQWPVPLRPDINFVDAGCAMSPYYDLPDTKQYEEMAERVSSQISDREKIKRISLNNVDYFDQHAAMIPVSAYITDVVTQKYPEIYNALPAA